MFDMQQIQQLQLKKVVADAEQHRLSELRRLKNIQERSAEKYNDCIKSKESAEKKFPEVMQQIEKKIQDNVNNGSNFIYYSFYTGSTEYAFIVCMLIQALFLKGYVCTFEDSSRILISW